MSPLQRFKVRVTGSGGHLLVFAPGNADGSASWRKVAQAFAEEHRVALYENDRGTSCDHLETCAATLLAVLAELGDEPVVFVGHGPAALAGVHAAVLQPQRFAGLVQVAPVPCGAVDSEFTRVGIERLCLRLARPSLILERMQEPGAPLSLGRFVHEATPGSTYVALEASGHSPQLSAPGETAFAIAHFVASLP